MDLNKYFEARVQEIHAQFLLMWETYKEIAKVEGPRSNLFGYYNGIARGYQEAAALLLAKDEGETEDG